MARRPHPIVAELKADRLRLGLSLRDVRERSGLATATVNDWELGRRFPTLLAVEAYTHFLGRPILLGAAQETSDG